MKHEINLDALNTIFVALETEASQGKIARFALEYMMEQGWNSSLATAGRTLRGNFASIGGGVNALAAEIAKVNLAAEIAKSNTTTESGVYILIRDLAKTIRSYNEMIGELVEGHAQGDYDLGPFAAPLANAIRTAQAQVAPFEVSSDAPQLVPATAINEVLEAARRLSSTAEDVMLINSDETIRKLRARMDSLNDSLAPFDTP